MEVSVIIVSMNNYEVLSRCLDSIRTHTSTSYEVFVVAYLFSPENLQHLRQNYPWAQIIESNEIRGFSANNNLALRKATGKYCFVLNDDTKIESDVRVWRRRSTNYHRRLLSSVQNCYLPTTRFNTAADLK